jgi:hypothetical protein
MAKLILMKDSVIEGFKSILEIEDQREPEWKEVQTYEKRDRQSREFESGRGYSSWRSSRKDGTVQGS